MRVTASHALVGRWLQSDAAAITAGHGVFVTDNGMYETRFGLNRKPFQAVLTNADFFQSAAYTELAESVLHALRSDLGVAVLTGPSGIGKTVTLDRFRRELDRDGQAMVLRGGNIQSTDDLLQSLHRRLIPPPGKNTQQELSSGNAQRWEVLERMQRVADFWGPTIILLDDAHLAHHEVFAELRTLLEEESDGHKLVRLLIAGPLTFEEFLAEPSMADFAQRIRAHEFLQPLTSSESVTYLQHQLQRVGGDASAIFEKDAIERIVAAADGVPRCIDMLADESMIAADRAELSVVDRASVDNALSRLRHLPHSWNVSLIDSDDDIDDEDDFPTQPEAPSPKVITAQAASHSVAPNAVEIGGPAPAAIQPVVVDTASGPGVIEIGGPSPAAPAAAAVTAAVAATAAATQQVTKADNQASTSGSIEIGGEADARPSTTALPAATFVQDFAEESASTASGLVDDAQETIQSIEEISADLGTEVSAEEFAEDVSGTDDDTNNDSGGESPSRPPAPAKPIDFDKVFGAVTIAGGGIAVSKAIVSEGRSNPSPAPRDNVPSNSVNLEQHMILAGNSDDDAGTLGETETTVTVETEQSETAADVTSLSDYAPWEPAGKWHSTPASPRSFFHSPSHANSKPVFDRFTWCELGRPVSRAPVKCATNITTGTEDVQWPPVTNFIAPANDISVEPMDDEYTGLLADLGILVDSTASSVNHSASQTPSATTVQPPDASTEDQESTLQLHSPVAGFVSPEESIDNIEQLLQADDDSAEEGGVLKSNWFGSRDDTPPSPSKVAGTEPDTNSEDAEVDATADSVETDPVSGTDNRHSASEQLFTLPINIQDVEFDPTVNLRPDSPGDDGPGMSVVDDQQIGQQTDVQGAVTDQLNSEAELEQVGDVSIEGNDEKQQIYTPRLLKNARSRVTSVSAGVGGLRRAAGAESLADQNEADETESYPEIHTPAEETQQPPASSFSNLFTRLRQLRGR